MNVSADLAALFFYLFSLFHHFTRSPSNYKGISLILSLSVLKQQPLGWKCTHQTSSQTVENFVSTAGIQQGKRNLVVFVMATSKLFCNRYLKFNGSFFSVLQFVRCAGALGLSCIYAFLISNTFFLVTIFNVSRHSCQFISY